MANTLPFLWELKARNSWEYSSLTRLDKVSIVNLQSEMQNVEKWAGGNLPQGLSLEGAQNEFKNVQACLCRENGDTFKDIFVNIINDGRKYLFG